MPWVRVDAVRSEDNAGEGVDGGLDASHGQQVLPGMQGRVLARGPAQMGDTEVVKPKAPKVGRSERALKRLAGWQNESSTCGRR